MPRSNKNLKFSVNPFLIDKIPPKNKRSLSQGFEPAETTIDNLAGVVSKRGWAFSYHFVDKKRSVVNFLATDIVPIDIDGGVTIEEMLENPIFMQYGALIYTTPSHKTDHHRFRVVFVLPRTITKANELTAVKRSLSRRLGGDPAATDAARLFYGSEGCTTWVFDREISDDFLGELIEDGKIKPQSDSILNKGIATSRSLLILKGDKAVITAEQHAIELKDINKTTTIYCPFHHDQNPSAFVAINEKGSKFIRCSSCQMTWWMDDGKSYDFYSFDEAVKRLVDPSSSKDKPITGALKDMALVSNALPSNIHISNNEYLQISHISEGITFIKSPKGTGKTTFLAEIIKNAIQAYPALSFEEYEEKTAYDTDPPIYNDKKVLLIGHRQALIGDLCNKLDLNCYLDDHTFRPAEILERQKRYGVCLDSLRKVQDKKYDIVVIDEVEQVLAHFMSDTIGEKRNNLFALFAYQVMSAKQVIALDADLDWVSFNTLTTLPINKLLNGKEPTKPKKFPIHIYLNDFKPESKSLNIYQTQSQLLHNMMENISKGKRVFITSNSKEKIKTIEKTILKFDHDSGLKLKMITITSENSRKHEIQHFIKNISDQITDYDVILSSPSLGTGIDITFENKREDIDCVYGFFENLINSHFEIDQQLARVRHPGEVNVWISPACYNFETEFQVVTQDYMKDHLYDLVLGKSPTLDMGDVDPFFRMIGMITSRERASKNNLKKNFIDLKVHQGWDVLVQEKDDDLCELGNALFKEGKKLRKTEYFNLMLNAESLNECQHLEFKQAIDRNDAQIEPEQWYSYYRTNTELFYREPVSMAILELDNMGKYSRAIRQLERVLIMPNIMKGDDSHTEHREQTKIGNKLLKNRNDGTTLLYGLLSLTPIFTNGQFNSDVIFTKDDLAKFSKAAIKMKALAELHLELTTKGDVLKKPVQHLGKVLKLIGLKQVCVKTSKHNGSKIYHYSLNTKVLNRANDILVNRRSDTDWSYVNKLHDFEYTDLEEV